MTKQRSVALNVFAVVVLALAYGLSFAALIFSGKLESGVGLAIDAAFGAMVIGGLIAAWRSSLTFAIGGPDSNPTAVFAAVAATVAAALSVTNAVPTVLMMMTLVTACTGIVFFVLGRFGAGRIVRLVPQPMIAGFNALSGVLCLLGALRVLAGKTLSLAALPSLETPTHIAQIGIGICFGILLIVVRRRFGPAAISVAFIAAMVGSLIISWILRDSLGTLRADGWLFSLPSVVPWLPWTAAHGSIDWALIGAHAGDIGVVVFVAVAALLINATGLELLSGQDVDLDKELRVAGIGNLIGALVGAMVSYVTFSRSAANFVLGTRTRLVGVAVACAAGAIVLTGPERTIGLVPIFAPAGVLIAVGGELAYQWLFENRKHQALGDTITTWLIVVVAIGVGFMAGILVGLAAGCITFVVRYSRIDAVERRLDGASFRSRLQRSQREHQALLEHGQNVRFFALRGYIFFGIADKLYRDLFAHAQGIDGPGWIVLDFAGVTGMDSSAAGAFLRLVRNVQTDRVRVVFSGMRGRVATLWNASLDEDARTLSFEEADLAMEWCETDLLRLFDTSGQGFESMELWLSQEFGADLAGRVIGQLQRIELATGEVLCAAGEPSDRMFFIESGRIAVIVGNDKLQRLTSLGPHTIIGEMGLYRHTDRSASVVAEMPTVAFSISRDALDLIQVEHPIESMAFHAAVVRTMADRLEYQNLLLASLLE